MSTIDSIIAHARPASQRPRGSNCAELLTRVRQAGLLDRRSTFYAVRIAINAALVVAGWTVFVLLKDSWRQLVTAAYLAVVFTQIGFLGHDAGHRQIFRSRGANQLGGLLHGNLAIGLAFGWAIDKHRRHCAHPTRRAFPSRLAELPDRASRRSPHPSCPTGWRCCTSPGLEVPGLSGVRAAPGRCRREP